MRVSSGCLSAGLHALGAVVLFSIGGLTLAPPQLHPKLGRDAIPIAPLRWRGNGGGGQKEVLPASKGRLPPVAPHRTFMPPMAHAINEHPKLAVAQAMLVDADIPVPDVKMDRIGSPWGVDGLLSGGRGGPGGIGEGNCCGVGDGKGPGGDGSITARAAKPKITRGPQVLFMIEPEYSDEARKARFQGTVVVAAEIGADGKAHNVRIVRPLGLGLDEKALEAVAKWRFRPAPSGGTSVPAPATIEVAFHLL